MIFRKEEILVEKEYISTKTKYFAKYVVYSDLPILFSFFGNFGELDDIVSSFQYRDDVVKKSRLNKVNYIEIRDYSGNPDTNRDGRLYIKNYLNNTPSNLKGMLFVGANLLLSIMVKTGMRALRNKMAIIISKDTDDALKSAYKILSQFEDTEETQVIKKLRMLNHKVIVKDDSILNKFLFYINKLNFFSKADNFLSDKDYSILNKVILRLTWFKDSTIEEFIPKTKNKKLNEIYETLLILNNDVNKFISSLNQNIDELKLETKKRAIAEEELKIKNKELNKSYDDLKKSQDVILKQEKLASLGTLSAGIAHEINNPAQAIKFSMEGLKLNLKDINYYINEIQQLDKIQNEKEKVEFLKKIAAVHDYLDIDTAIEEMNIICKSNLSSIERIEGIVNSTKRLAYKNSDYKQIDIHMVINDAMLLCKNDLKQNVKIETDFHDDIPQFIGVSQELIQVFINLITNSIYELIEKKNEVDVLNKIQYPAEVTVFLPRINIKTSFMRERNTIKIEFNDNGRGISEKNLKKIFDPFFTTKPQGKGTGLGMSLVYKILEHHHGKIEIDDNYKDGTQFNIFIPINKKNDAS